MIRRTVAWTGLPARSIVAFGDGVAVAILGGWQPGRRTNMVSGLPLRAEVVDEATAASLGWRSMRATVDIDCDHRRDMVKEMVVFDDHDLKGQSSRPTLPTTWGQPDRLAYLGGVIAAVCQGVKPAGSPEPSELAKSTVTSPPPVVSRRPTTAPAPTPAKVRGAVASIAPIPSREPRAAAGPVVQIAAGGSEEGARHALQALQAPGLAGLTREVQKATKDGKPLYRAVIGGFASRGDAVSFCQALQKARQSCLVR